MLLTVDAGNTNINLALFQGNKIIARQIIPTALNDYYANLVKLLQFEKPHGIIVSSVVPRATQILKSDFKRLSMSGPLILGKDFIVPVKNKYKFPEQVGQDRLVNGFAALRLYGSPCLVIDFGTAITFDVLSEKKEYKGGLIIPGFRISLEALASKTALLPKIDLGRPKALVGKDTASSILSGVVYGYAAMTDGLIRKLKKQFTKKPFIIGTGGNIDFIARYCQEIGYIDKDLTLKGLNLIYSCKKEN